VNKAPFVPARRLGLALILFAALTLLCRDPNTLAASATMMGAETNQPASPDTSPRQHSQEAKLTAAGGADGGEFGNAVAFSNDGNTLIIGAQYAGTGGASYVFVRSGIVGVLPNAPTGTWTQQAALSLTGDIHFGRAVAISADGNTIAIGAPVEDVAGNTDQGAAYIFTRNGAVWSQQQRLTASDGGANDEFGRSVALNGDGNEAIVGAHGHNEGRGAAYVFTRSGGAWSQQHKLTPNVGNWINVYFGKAAALNSSGDTAIIGAYLETYAGGAQQGVAYAFARSGGVWSQQGKLKALDHPNGARFGYAVGICGDGNTAVIGAYNISAVYVFTRAGAIWSQRQKLTASDRDASSFGAAVAVSADCTTCTVGASNVTIETNADQGAAYLFGNDGGAWMQRERLTASDGKAYQLVGAAVGINGDGTTGAAGAPLIGSVYVFAGALPPALKLYLPLVVR